MFQNPEVQCANPKDRTEILENQLAHLCDRADEWTHTNLIDGYGILSHGLSLPSSHPMHLGVEALHLRKYSVLQVPVNIVQGWTVAQQLASSSSSGTAPLLYGMRPLHVFPEPGIPYKLVDYQLDSDGT